MKAKILWIEGKRAEGPSFVPSLRKKGYGVELVPTGSAALSRIAELAPDVVVFNTCAVRENADNRLYGNLGQLRPVKERHPGMQIAVGGCLAHPLLRHRPTPPDRR